MGRRSTAGKVAGAIVEMRNILKKCKLPKNGNYSHGKVFFVFMVYIFIAHQINVKLKKK